MIDIKVTESKTVGTDGNDVIHGRDDGIKNGGRIGDGDQINAGDGNDIVIGDTENDNINGGKGDDILYGGGGHDNLFGYSGDDILIGGAGNDILNGGATGDRDVVIYSGCRDEYEITDPDSGWKRSYIQVKDLREGSPDGTDFIQQQYTEFVQFADGMYDVKNDSFKKGTKKFDMFIEHLENGSGTIGLKIVKVDDEFNITANGSAVGSVVLDDNGEWSFKGEEKVVKANNVSDSEYKVSFQSYENILAGLVVKGYEVSHLPEQWESHSKFNQEWLYLGSYHKHPKTTTRTLSYPESNSIVLDDARWHNLKDNMEVGLYFISDDKKYYGFISKERLSKCNCSKLSETLKGTKVRGKHTVLWWDEPGCTFTGIDYSYIMPSGQTARNSGKAFTLTNLGKGYIKQKIHLFVK